jgi:hypothetical protein
MGRSQERELKTKRLQLEKARAKSLVLQEQVALAEHVMWDSQFVVSALSSPYAQIRNLPSHHRQAGTRRR